MQQSPASKNMPHLPALLGFALVSFGLVLTPGPNMISLISRSIKQGGAAGIVSLGAVALGFVFYMLCAAFGISALLLAVPYAYDALRLAGAAYLLWLAWQGGKPGGRSPFPGQKLPRRRSKKTVRDGFRHQSAQPEDRDALSGAAAAVHRSRRRQRADAIAGVRFDPDRDQRQRQRHDRARRRIDRAVFGPAADLAVGAALPDGHRARGACGQDGVRGEAGVADNVAKQLACHRPA